MTISEITQRLHAKASNGHWMARYPAHDDKEPSLQISEEIDTTSIAQAHRGGRRK